jgi:hypothetical protein
MVFSVDTKCAQVSENPVSPPNVAAEAGNHLLHLNVRFRSNKPIEAVGLWDERVSCSFQALARQIHNLPLGNPMLPRNLGL